MAVIWREDLTINGKVYPDRKVYKSPSFVVTKDEEKRAEKLDKFIEAKIREVKRAVQEKGFLGLKKKKGVLELWYLVGKNLQFVDNTKLVPQEDKQFVWEAVWYHVKKIAPELIPGKQRKRRGTYRDHFLQCYKLGKFPWRVIKRGGGWSEWQEFFDSRTINEDCRILEWLFRKIESEPPKDYWLKSFYRLLKQKFFGKVTEVLSDKDLFQELELVWEKHKTSTEGKKIDERQ